MHWIQARKAWEPGQPEIPVSVAANEDGVVELRGKGVELTMLWTHDPVHLNKLRRGGMARAHWLPRFHVLTVNGTSFNLAELDQRTTCLHEDDHLPEHAGETVTERALRHAHERGGYSVRATELMGDQ